MAPIHRLAVLLMVLDVPAGTLLAGEETEAVPEDEKDFQALIDGQNLFALEFYSRLAGAEGNIFFSPVSIHAALTMLQAGARDDTDKQLMKCLHLKLGREATGQAYNHFISDLLSGAKYLDYEQYKISFANALWVQRGFAIEKEFPETLKDNFHADVFLADFKEGREAAGTTVIDVAGGSAEQDPSKPVIFRADHPFLFLIRHRQTVLFMGRLSDPAR
jgi:serine protease inhibitor